MDPSSQYAAFASAQSAQGPDGSDQNYNHAVNNNNNNNSAMFQNNMGNPSMMMMGMNTNSNQYVPSGNMMMSNSNNSGMPSAGNVPLLIGQTPLHQQLSALMNAGQGLMPGMMPQGQGNIGGPNQGQPMQPQQQQSMQQQQQQQQVPPNFGLSLQQQIQNLQLAQQLMAAGALGGYAPQNMPFFMNAPQQQMVMPEHKPEAISTNQQDLEWAEPFAGKGKKEPPFPLKLHQILSNPEFSECICWNPHGRSWRILKPPVFEQLVIPLYFRHAKYASFMRQVNGWGFKRIVSGNDHNSYYHELFVRDYPQLCLKMKRIKKGEAEKKAHGGKEGIDDDDDEEEGEEEQHSGNVAQNPQQNGPGSTDQLPPVDVGQFGGMVPPQQDVATISNQNPMMGGFNNQMMPGIQENQAVSQQQHAQGGGLGNLQGVDNNTILKLQEALAAVNGGGGSMANDFAPQPSAPQPTNANQNQMNLLSQQLQTNQLLAAQLQAATQGSFLASNNANDSLGSSNETGGGTNEAVQENTEEGV